MKKIKCKELEQEEQRALFNKICDDIIDLTNEYRTLFNSRNYNGIPVFGADLTDVGDFIGKAIGQNTYKDEKDLNIWTYDKESFVFGFYHGYSLHDGTHDSKIQTGKKIKYKVLEQEEQRTFFNKICDDIIQITNEYRTAYNSRKRQGVSIFGADLTDLGDFIGKAIGQNTCKGAKDLNIWAYDEESFVGGFYHGYSLQDGTH